MMACLYQRQIFILTPVKHTSLLQQISKLQSQKVLLDRTLSDIFWLAQKKVLFNYLVKKKKKDIVVRASLSVENAPA
jgi:hypothetical protein